MNKVLVIGKLNDVTKQINEALSEFVRVQICADNESVVEGMMRLIDPDLVIVLLVGGNDSHEEIFALLARYYKKTPVIAVGSPKDETRLTNIGYLADGRVRFLRRPLKMEDLVDWTKELLPHDEPRDEMKTILVVDDNPNLLRTMQNMLSKHYKVMFATSGTQALMSVTKQKPDLIILDYDMPVVDGKMTLQMLRSEKATKDIPVIFLTGMSDPTHVGEVLSFQPQGYLLKPPTEEKIFTAITGILGDEDW